MPKDSMTWNWYFALMVFSAAFPVSGVQPCSALFSGQDLWHILTFANIGKLRNIFFHLSLFLNGKRGCIDAVFFVGLETSTKEFDFANEFIRTRFDRHTSGVITLRV